MNSPETFAETLRPSDFTWRDFRALRWSDKIGFSKYLFNVGKEYAELFRGSLTPTLLVGFVATQQGASLKTSALSALGVPLAFIVVGLVAGVIVWRWRITHATIEREWENNPFARKQIDTLTEIRDELRKLNAPKITICPFCKTMDEIEAGITR